MRAWGGHDHRHQLHRRARGPERSARRHRLPLSARRHQLRVERGHGRHRCARVHGARATSGRLDHGGRRVIGRRRPAGADRPARREHELLLRVRRRSAVRRRRRRPVHGGRPCPGGARRNRRRRADGKRGRERAAARRRAEPGHELSLPRRREQRGRRHGWSGRQLRDAGGPARGAPRPPRVRAGDASRQGRVGGPVWQRRTVLQSGWRLSVQHRGRVPDAEHDRRLRPLAGL